MRSPEKRFQKQYFHYRGMHLSLVPLYLVVYAIFSSLLKFCSSSIYNLFCRHRIDQHGLLNKSVE